MIIRKLHFDDLQLRVDWMNDERINSTLNIQLPVTLESTQNWFNRISSNESRIDFAFEENDEVVAMGGFTDINKEVGKAELYIFVSPDKKGGGIGTRAVDLMIKYGFEELKLDKIYLYTNSDNIAARRLYDKLGFTLEGYMPHEVINNGKIKDRCFYGIYNNLNNNQLPPPI